MHLFKSYLPKDGYTPLVKPGKDGINLLEVGVLHLSPGRVYRGSSQEAEVCLIFLAGLANVTAGEAQFPSIGSRANVFAGRATAVHVPPGYKFKVEAVGALEIAIARTPSDLPGEPRSPIDPDPNVCSLHGRCFRGTDACQTTMPALREVAPGRRAACHFPIIAGGARMIPEARPVVIAASS